MDNKELIGLRINTALAKRNMKQKQLAKAIGVTDNTISYFCSGKRTPNIQQLIAIAKELDVPTDYLLGRTNTMTVKEDIQVVCKTTGLNDDSIRILYNLNNSKAYTRKVRQSIINHILSGEIFWEETLKHLESAWRLRRGISNPNHPDLSAKAKDLAEQMKILNLGEITDYVVLPGEEASDLQIQYAANSMKKLFLATLADILREDGKSNGKR